MINFFARLYPEMQEGNLYIFECWIVKNSLCKALSSILTLSSDHVPVRWLQIWFHPSCRTAGKTLEGRPCHQHPSSDPINCKPHSVPQIPHPLDPSGSLRHRLCQLWLDKEVSDCSPRSWVQSLSPRSILHVTPTPSIAGPDVGQQGESYW